DLFIEMHYQRSFRSQEPPRLYPAPFAVPVTGRELPLGSFEESAGTPNPLPREQSLARSGPLFKVNCSPCHGLGARGDSFVADKFREAGGAAPADLGSQRVRARNQGQLYWIITNGLGEMPPFGRLLSPDERWTLVHFVSFFAENTR
ncbi:MAG: cytochrome c, partial [Chloroflexi bacterium]|nr:cytochrome c [Chloroflexota bacterium]